MKKSILILQGGGPTSVVNSSLKGAIIEARKSSFIEGILGSRYGVEGLLDDEIVDLEELDKEDLNLLSQTPGAFLGSSRKRLDLEGEEGKKALATLSKHNVGYLLLIGGNDTMETALELSAFFLKEGEDILVLGVPKTIDNDLLETDHTPGYPSAARHLVNAVKAIGEDARSYKNGKVTIVESMGRETGWLAASGFALSEEDRPDLIYLPEMNFDIPSFLKDVKEVYERKGTCLVLISEGIDLGEKESPDAGDGFAHPILEGAAVYLSKFLKKEGLPSRAVVLSLAMRADPLSIAPVDVWEAESAAHFAVSSFRDGENAKMAAIVREKDVPYEASFSLVPLAQVAGKTRYFPSEWIVSPKEVAPSFLAYIQPLIAGEAPLERTGGIYKSARLPKEGSKGV